MVLEPLVETASPILIRTLWQGALIALLLKAILMVLGDSKAHLRYVISCAALATMVVLSVLTGLRTAPEHQIPAATIAETEQVALSAAQLTALPVGDVVTRSPRPEVTPAAFWDPATLNRWFVPLWFRPRR